VTDAGKLVRAGLTRIEELLAANVIDKSASEAALVALGTYVEKLLEPQLPKLALSEQLWSSALLRQAREDLTAAELLAGCGGPASVTAMLLQMVFEKLAKAALARTDIQAFHAHRTSHVAASRLVNIIKNHGKYIRLNYDWRDVLPMVQALERAHPAVAKRGPHLEYPWEAGGEVALPSTHLSIVAQIADPRDLKTAKLFRFARELSKRFDELFG
jgi:hypothetical protein